MSHRTKAAIAAAIAVLVVPASASAATRVVDMGTPPAVGKVIGKSFTDANAFFPATTTIHTGDKVRFVVEGFHNLDLPKKGGAPTALFAPKGLVSGAVDAAGAPFWFNNQNNLQFNLPALLPKGFGKSFTYNGSKGVQSGLPLAAKPKPVSVTFTKSGTYTYFCDLHAGMQARVKVVGKSKSIPSAKAHAKLIKDQGARAIATAKKIAKITPPANTVDLGVAGGGGVEQLAMKPAALTVAKGTTVTFTMSAGSREVHTATFGPGNIEDPKSFIGKIAASFEGNIDQSGVYPSDPPPAVASLTPTSHGNGFWNSGVLDTSNATPVPVANRVTFSTPGTYTYYCLIHPFMKGTVTVQ